MELREITELYDQDQRIESEDPRYLREESFDPLSVAGKEIRGLVK